MMFALPIVDRELRVAARRKGTFWLRFWVALVMLIIWVLILENDDFASPAQRGRLVLNVLGILALGFSLLAGMFLTADCLSEEKREGTLGLLFLTDLKPYDVVLGKLVANSLNAFFGLLAVFPIFGLSLLLGGVTGPEFGRLSLVFVMTLYFSLSLGVAVSAVSRDAKQSLVGALFLLMFFAGVCPAIWWLQHWLFTGAPFDFLLSPSPAYAYRMGYDAYYRAGGGAAAFWTSIGTLFGLGTTGILLANLVLPRVWQEGNREVTRKPGWKGRFKSAPISSAVRVAWQRRLEPMYWLAARDGSPQRMAWLGLLLVFPLWILAVAVMVHATMFGRQEPFIMALATAYGMHLLMKALIAAEAARRMNQDRRNGAWELLLVTPLKVEAILAGQMKALQKHFFAPMLALIGVNVAMMTVMHLLSDGGSTNNEELNIFTEIFIGGIIALFLDFFGLAWVGMWRGLNAKQHHRAVIASLAQIVVVPLLVFFFLMFVTRGGGPDGGMMMILIWFIMGAALSMISAGVARNRLRTEFRDVVAGTNQQRPWPDVYMKDDGV